MADSSIGSLPQAANLDDDSLLVAEQQGQAVKVTGAQFKEFGKQAVIGQVQGYVDQAEAAANRAADAVSSVTDMTVEAATLASGRDATVTKTMKQDKVNLAFGLPRGAQGIPGPSGPEGPQGPKGEKGDGLDIVGRYDTTADVPNPQEGKSYYIGTQAPYDLCTYINGEWVNNGPISGGGSGVLPDDVVTAEGGASMTFPVDLGDSPHTITFTEEEEPPLTAEDVQYSETQTVKDAIDGLKSSVSDGKALVASAITDKGVDTAQDATFGQMAENIGKISTGSDTSDATATSFDILAPKTAYTAVGKVEGVIPTLLGQTITPGTADKTIANGQYLGGTQVIKGDPNLTSSNIKKGVTLFGVDGALESSFQAILTVTADTGAVVTATHTDGTKVEALSQTGTVVLDLPKEGTWKVTAVRGVAQYNTVTVEVSSQYSAELTAEVHIEYYGAAANLSVARYDLASASVGNFALFAGGRTVYYTSEVNHSRATKRVDVYDNVLTKQSNEIGRHLYGLAGASVGGYALFAGGAYYAYNSSTSANEEYFSSSVYAFSSTLSLISASDLSLARRSLAAASIGDYALFGGGRGGNSAITSIVDAYSNTLTHSTPTALAIQSEGLAAASNDNYAIFAGGSAASVNNQVTTYDSELVRTAPTALSAARLDLTAAKAGNYVLFAGGRGGAQTVEAYDLFLTRTTAESLSDAKEAFAGTTVNGFAVFAGYSKTVDVYDAYLVRTSPKGLGAARKELAAAAIENYALFAGGNGTSSNTTYYNKVDVYQYV